jgi:hypothetical protein
MDSHKFNINLQRIFSYGLFSQRRKLLMAPKAKKKSQKSTKAKKPLEKKLLPRKLPIKKRQPKKLLPKKHPLLRKRLLQKLNNIRAQLLKPAWVPHLADSLAAWLAVQWVQAIAQASAMAAQARVILKSKI